MPTAGYRAELGVGVEAVDNLLARIQKVAHNLTAYFYFSVYSEENGKSILHSNAIKSRWDKQKVTKKN